jgi:hypothetical protein
VADHVVRSTQSPFMQGWYILDGVFSFHEMVYVLHRKNMNDVILKIDLKKAYDKVMWSFLQ